MLPSSVYENVSGLLVDGYYTLLQVTTANTSLLNNGNEMLPLLVYCMQRSLVHVAVHTQTDKL